MLPLNWQDFTERHRVGDVVSGRVTKVVAFGVFVEIDGFDGLLVGADGPPVGDNVSARIAAIDTEQNRFSLTPV